MINKNLNNYTQNTTPKKLPIGIQTFADIRNEIWVSKPMNNNILINQKLDVIKNLTPAKQFKQNFAEPSLIEKIENMDCNQFLDFLIDKELLIVVAWSGEEQTIFFQYCHALVSSENF